MKLEDELKHKCFKSPYHRMMVNIMFTGNFLQKWLLCMMREFKISPQQHNVLSIVRGQHPEPCSLGDIQERMLDRMSNATRLVDKLLEKNLVARCQCPNNRRKIEITITQEGVTLLKKIEDKIPTYDTLFPAISPEEATILGQLLDKSRE